MQTRRRAHASAWTATSRLLRRAPVRGSWRTSSRAGVSSLITPRNAQAAVTIRHRSSPSLTRMPEWLQTRTLTTRSCMSWPMPWWGRPTGMIRSGRPRRWRWAVQDTAVTTGNSPHRATLSRARMRAGSRRPSGGSGAPCVAPVMARYGIRRTQSTAGSRQPRAHKEERAPAWVLAVRAVSLGPLRIQGTLCSSCLTMRQRYATRKPLIFRVENCVAALTIYATKWSVMDQPVQSLTQEWKAARGHD